MKLEGNILHEATSYDFLLRLNVMRDFVMTVDSNFEVRFAAQH